MAVMPRSAEYNLTMGTLGFLFKAPYYLARAVYRHPKFSALLALSALAADVTFGPRAIETYLEKTPAVFSSLSACTSEVCSANRAEILRAFRMWKAQHPNAPLSDRHYIVSLLGSAAIESKMGSLPDTKGSSYWGVFQMSPRKGNFIEDKNSSRPDLKKKRGPDGKIVKDVIADRTLEGIQKTGLVFRAGGKEFPAALLKREDLEKKEIFNNVTLQTFGALEIIDMFVERAQGKGIQLASTSPEDSAVWIYLGHNMPEAMWSAYQQLNCRRPMSEIRPTLNYLMSENAGLYGYELVKGAPFDDKNPKKNKRFGTYSPAEVYYTIWSKMKPTWDDANAHAGLDFQIDTRGSGQPRRPWQYGFTAWGIAELANGKLCTYNRS